MRQLKKSKDNRFNRWIFETTQSEYSQLLLEMFDKNDTVELFDENGNSLGKYRIGASNFLQIGNGLFSFTFADLSDNIAEQVSYIIITKVIYKAKPQIEHKVKCPTCGSTDVTRISDSEKVLNIFLFGLYGNKRKKQFHCNNCNYNW